jgi:copper chaperone CopZ
MSENVIVLPILGMTCTNCSAVERSLNKEPGVKKVSVEIVPLIEKHLQAAAWTVTLEKSNVDVNMPFIIWKGGKR